MDYQWENRYLIENYGSDYLSLSSFEQLILCNYLSRHSTEQFANMGRNRDNPSFVSVKRRFKSLIRSTLRVHLKSLDSDLD